MQIFEQGLSFKKNTPSVLYKVLCGMNTILGAYAQ
jgi:hypothetical protein